MKKFVKIMVVVIFGLIAMVACLGGESIPEDVEYKSMEISTMYEELDTNAFNAEEKYNDAYIKIKGRISNIDSDGGYISIEDVDASEWDLFETVMCDFLNDEQREVLKTKSAGDIVTIEGQVYSVGEGLGYSMSIHTIK